MEKGTLYMLPATLGDTPPFDVLPAFNGEIIDKIDYFIVENTRSARRFLSRAGIGKPIDSLLFAELNEQTDLTEIPALARPLFQGRDAGVISEAGVPGVADPGAELAAYCHDNGIRVVPLVGPSSILLAIMASGLNGQSFAFNGYLPVKPEERSRAIKRFESRARNERQTQIFIETPYRNLKLFEEFMAHCSPSTRLCVAADLTLPSEYIRTSTIGQWKKSPVPQINKRPAIFLIL